jgi:hypothetical protein
MRDGMPLRFSQIVAVYFVVDNREKAASRPCNTFCQLCPQSLNFREKERRTLESDIV